MSTRPVSFMRAAERTPKAGASGRASINSSAIQLAEAAPQLEWRVAEVTEVVSETPRVKTLALRVPEWTGHRPGQHVDVRLTGEDGYQAQRSFSIASPPEAPQPALTVKRIEGVEVSPYLVAFGTTSCGRRP